MTGLLTTDGFLRAAIKKALDVDVIGTTGMGADIVGTEILFARRFPPASYENTATWWSRVWMVSRVRVPGLRERAALAWMLDHLPEVTPRGDEPTGFPWFGPKATDVVTSKIAKKLAEQSTKRSALPLDDEREKMEINDVLAFPRENSVVHELKTHPIFFGSVLSGAKPFEIRKNDRGFKLGDILKLCEWEPLEKKYTGRFCFRMVTSILDDSALDTKDYGVLKEGYVVLGLGRVP